jgi:zinc transport system ATP-binding protein
MRVVLLLLLFLLPALATATVPVAVSVVPQKTFVKAVGGDAVSVQVMVGKGFDPATWQPTPRQLAGLARARLYVRTGVPFEAGWMPRFRRINPRMMVLDMRQGISLIPLRSGESDPHVWTDPQVVKKHAARLRDALSSLDPTHARRYQQGYQALAQRLDELDAELARKLAPLEGRTFLVFHPAWGYFARRYGLKQLAVEREGKEPGARALAQLIEGQTFGDPYPHRATGAQQPPGAGGGRCPASQGGDGGPAGRRLFRRAAAHGRRTAAGRQVSTAAIEVKQVSFAYGEVSVLKGVNLAVSEGEFLGIVGPNAGGKSTLLKLILGLLEPQQGEIRVFGQPPRKARKLMGYVPQHPAFSRDFPVTVEQVVLMGRLGISRLLGGYSRRDRQVAQRVMREAEVSELARRRIGQLSGGQLQRVLVARALACEPRILLLDEPTANIDMRVENELFDLLKKLNERMTILVVSHDIAFISRYVQRVACLNRTLVCHRTEEIDAATIQELYGGEVRMVHHHYHP